MNQGKHGIRNTVFALYGAVVLFFAVNRLYAATVHAGAPQWLVNVVSLGLAPASASESKARYLADVAVHDFTRLHVIGRLTVEIVGAPQYHLSFTAVDGRNLPLEVRQEGDELWLVGVMRGDAAATDLLRIETPALAQVDARKLSALTLRGLQLPELTVDLNDVTTAHLLENNVQHWTLHSDVSAEVQVDKVTLAAGTLQTTGRLNVQTGE